MPISFLYIHGFNSSPKSSKALSFLNYCHNKLPEIDIKIPELSVNPEAALNQLETIIKLNDVQLIVGSSLGGYFATYLSEKNNIRTVLINPAVWPFKNVNESFIGKHKNIYTDEEFEISKQDVSYIETLSSDSINMPQNILVLLEAGDTVLDYRQALEKYSNCQQIVHEDGDHRYTRFEEMLPQIIHFAGY